MMKAKPELGIVAFILGLFLLALMAGCAERPGPGPLAPETVARVEPGWTPVDNNVEDCSRQSPGTLAVAIHLAFALEQATTTDTWDSCCWVQGGDVWFRQIIVTGPEYSVYASRVLRPEEPHIEDRHEMVGHLELVSAVILQWNSATSERCWRESSNGVLEQMYIGPMQAAPLDYQWAIELRKRL